MKLTDNELLAAKLHVVDLRESRQHDMADIIERLIDIAEESQVDEEQLKKDVAALIESL